MYKNKYENTNLLLMVVLKVLTKVCKKTFKKIILNCHTILINLVNNGPKLIGLNKSDTKTSTTISSRTQMLALVTYMGMESNHNLIVFSRTTHFTIEGRLNRYKRVHKSFGGSADAYNIQLQYINLLFLSISSVKNACSYSYGRRCRNK